MNDLVKQEDQLPAVQTTPILQMIEKVANNPEFDPDKLERMLDMQERILDRDAEVAFNQAMARAQSNMPVIEKNKFNDQTKSWYATLDMVNQSAVTVYTAEGFSVSYNTVDSPLGSDFLRVVAYVSHIDGHTREYQYDMPIDDHGMAGKKNKTLVHGRASSVSYAQRYLICLIFNISSAKDTDGNAPKAESDTVKPETLKTIRAKMKEVGRTEEQCLAFFAGIGFEYESLEEVSEQHALRLLNKMNRVNKEQ